MEEFLLELLSPLIELFLEVLFEYACGVIADVALRLANRFSDPSEAKNRKGIFLNFGLLGIATGLLSLAVFPHPLVRPSRFHGISLLLSPVATGWMLSLTGSTLRKRMRKVTLIQTFGYGFTFAFGMAFIRFLFAR